MTDSRESKTNKYIKAIFEWVELFALSIAAVMIIMTCIARHSPVKGDSMNETLHEKDILIISDLFYKPKQGDIVVFQRKDLNYNEPYVKRIIAVGGQTVNIDFQSRTVTVDGKVLQTEEYATYKGFERFYYQSGITYPYEVPEGCVFVLGDNRWNSRDSRDIGPVDERFIIGRVIWRIYPVDKIGKVK